MPRKWHLLLSHARKLAPAWVVMYDPDLRTTPSAAGFLSCFSLRPVGWAVCGANTPTSQPYYDLLALRTRDDWMPGDYRSCKRRCTCSRGLMYRRPPFRLRKQRLKATCSHCCAASSYQQPSSRAKR